MGYYQSVYLGACIRFVLTDQTQDVYWAIMESDRLQSVNGNWGHPADAVLYLASNSSGKNYGHSINAGDNESGTEIRKLDIDKWENRFKEDFYDIIEILEEKCRDNYEVIVALVNGGG